MNGNAASDPTKISELEERVSKIETQLSTKQVSALRSVLNGKAGAVEIINWQDNPNPALLSDYQAVFKDSGWSTKTSTAIFDRPDEGQALVLQPGSAFSGTIIKDALDRAQVPYETNRRPPLLPLNSFG